MRENRTHGSEGGDGEKAVPDPYQVCSTELVWIPAFAGMTDPGGLFVVIPSQVFSKEDTKSTMFGVLVIRTLRDLRAFVVSQISHHLLECGRA